MLFPSPSNELIQRGCAARSAVVMDASTSSDDSTLRKLCQMLNLDRLAETDPAPDSCSRVRELRSGPNLAVDNFKESPRNLPHANLDSQAAENGFSAPVALDYVQAKDLAACRLRRHLDAQAH
jgi:hypothetical protein